MQSDMKEREDPLCAVFSQNVRRVDSQVVLKFVAVGSFTADSRLLQPTGGVKTTPQKSESLQRNSRTGQKLNKWVQRQ